ncbi:MAG: DUF481 domain-containing protein [Steroidobacteraceae bacterium]
MQQTRNRAMTLALLFAVSCGLHALPAAAQWTGRGEAGIVIASGNTDTKAGNAKLVLKYVDGPWSHAGTFNGVYAADEDGTTARRWEATEQTEYRFNPRNYSFAGLRYESDQFSGFEHQGTLSAGFGHLFIENESTTLTGQIGVGYKFAEERDVYDETTGLLIEAGESVNSFAGLGKVDFKHAFNASTTLLNKLTVEYTADNTFIQNELALQVKMSDRLALAAGYAVRHNTEPPDGFDKTDTLTTMNIVYEVK